MRVMIGIPIYETFKAATGVSLLGAIAAFDFEYALTVKRGAYLDTLREECLNTALAAESDYLVFVDTDMQFRPDAIPRLLAHDKDIIGATYNEKRFPLTTTVKTLGENGNFSHGEHMPTELFQCAAVGTGLMAVNLHRLTAAMKPPYFNYESAERIHLNAALGRAGEDVAFCVRAAMCGLEVWCDPTIPVGHIGEFVY